MREQMTAEIEDGKSMQRARIPTIRRKIQKYEISYVTPNLYELTVDICTSAITGHPTYTKLVQPCAITEDKRGHYMHQAAVFENQYSVSITMHECCVYNFNIFHRLIKL
jgi:hypothetical protein